jgi:hypothetical protein
MNETDAKGDPNAIASRVLPDPAVCATKPIGAIFDFGKCLVDKPVECKYVLYFGEGNICRHPKWKDFVNSKKA